MTQQFVPVRLSLVHMMTWFLAGAVWLIAVTYAFEVFRASGDSPASNLFRSAMALLTSPPKSEGIDAPIYFIGLGVLAFIVGFVVEQISTGLAETILFPRDHFPYNQRHQDKLYFERISEILSERYNIKYETIPGHQPFSACKRILRMISPPLWEECERREAEVRTLGSLFIASGLSLLVAIFAFFTNHMETTGYAPVVSALVILMILGYAFRVARLSEVSRAYLNFVVAAAINMPDHAIDCEKHLKKTPAGKLNTSVAIDDDQR